MSDVLTGGQRAVTQPAAKALGYGNRAVLRNPPVARAPAKKARPKPKPTHVVKAESELRQLPDTIEVTVGNRKVTKSIKVIKRKIKVHDMKDYARISPEVVRGGFDAWTSSRVDVWVAPTAVRNDHWLRAVMFHEVLHIVQFRLAKSPPAKYERMVEFECAAYSDSADWLSNAANHPAHSSIVSWEKPVRGIAKIFCDKLQAVTTKNAKKRDKAFRDFLINNSMLPSHSKISDLYP